MGLMGSLYVGSSGLNTSQNALNTTAHNMSNMDTAGFVRQQVLLGTRDYTTLSINASSISNKQTGHGVVYSKVRQIRDTFLDQTYRKESGRSAFYENSYNTSCEIESLLGELQGSTFSQSLDDFWKSVQELANNPTSEVNQGLFVQRASEFIERATVVYEGLENYQDNLNLQIKSNIDKLNAYGNKLLALNEEIIKVECGGVENANDLRDERNRVLDEMSALANISYQTDISGNITVKLEGVDFVTKDTVYEMSVKTDEVTGFHTPFWPQLASYTLNANGEKIYNIDSAKVYDMTQVISSSTDTDIGSIKSMLFARGDKRANYTDLLNADKYNKEISQSVVMNVQAQFDQLIHAVVTSVNKILADASDPANDYLCNKDGSPMQLFTKKTGSAYTLQPDGTWKFNPEITNDPNRTETLYSIKNLQINGDLLKQPSKLKFRLPDGKEDQATVDKLKKAFEEEKYVLNPNVKSAANFIDYYSNLVSQVGNWGSVFYGIAVNQNKTVEATDAAREQIMGVSSEEELTNMIRFQNAYNASSRYINVIDEMLEHVLSTLGR